MNFNTAEIGAVSGRGKYTFWKANEQEEHQVDIKGKYQCVRSENQATTEQLGGAQKEMTALQRNFVQKFYVA